MCPIFSQSQRRLPTDFDNPLEKFRIGTVEVESGCFGKVKCPVLEDGPEHLSSAEGQRWRDRAAA